MQMHGRVLIVAGSDSGGGAGIQADIKAVTMLDAFAATAITALTAQNTLGVFGVLPIPPDFIRQQIEIVLDDLGADAIKTGMLHDDTVIETVAAVLAVIVETGKKASEVCRVFAPVPQLLRNVRFGRGKPLERRAVQQAIVAGEARLGTTGRLVIRPSGTEPVIRVMAQGEDEKLLANVVGDICEAIMGATPDTDEPQRAPRLDPVQAAE